MLYAGTKYVLSVRTKHLMMAAASRCLAYAQALDAKDTKLQDMVAEKLPTSLPKRNR